MAFAASGASGQDTGSVSNTTITNDATDVGQLIVSCTHPKTGVGVPFKVEVTNADQSLFYGVGTGNFTIFANAVNCDVTITATQVNADIAMHIIDIP